MFDESISWEAYQKKNMESLFLQTKFDKNIYIDPERKFETPCSESFCNAIDLNSIYANEVR